MTDQNLRFVIVASTHGSVMGELLKNDFFKSNIFSVVSDRQCGAIEKARNYGVRTDVILEKNKQIFCSNLLEYLEANNIDFVISFFGKMFVGELLEKYQDRIINLHPSLLPSFKGLDGFNEAINYGVRYVGSTIHFIDEFLDEGKTIMQTIYPIDENREISNIRHRVFEQQCKSLLQVVKWISEDRISINGNKVVIKNSKFEDFEFSPNLDFSDAIQINIPFNDQVFSNSKTTQVIQ